MMPRLTGCEAYERVSAIKPDMPVLFASALDDPTLRDHSAAAPNMMFLRKPYGSRSLIDALTELSGRACASA